MGVLKPRGGRVHLETRDITGAPPHRIVQMGIGYVPEERRIFPNLTVYENLKMARLMVDGRRRMDDYLDHVTAFPAQHVETFDPLGDAGKRGGDRWSDWPERYPRGGLLFHGDNKEVLAHLLANGFRGKVHLVYIDPPFDSGADYVRKVTLRGPKGHSEVRRRNLHPRRTTSVHRHLGQ